MMELTKAGTSDALVINSISKRAFDSDIEVGASSKGGPPGYRSVNFHVKMAKANHLYKLTIDGLIVGGAILFEDGLKLNIGRIFVDPEYFRKGYGIFIMQEIERIYPAAKELYLDTPAWNIRTNAFYQKLGYIGYKKSSLSSDDSKNASHSQWNDLCSGVISYKIKKDDEFIYYIKKK